MTEKLFLSVIIPCFNEENNLRNGCLDGVISYFKNCTYPYEILVIDDASTDGSAAILKRYEQKRDIKLIEKEHSFKAGTVMRGIREARAKFVLMTDMDQATPITEFDKFLPFLRENAEIVIGSRRDERKGAPLSRKIMAKGFIMLRNLILGLNEIKDTQCGFKIFKREAALKIIGKLKLFADNEICSQTSKVTAGFDVEILFLAKKLGYRIVEIPVAWNYVETRRVNPLRDSLDGLIDMLRICGFDLIHAYD